MLFLEYLFSRRSVFSEMTSPLTGQSLEVLAPTPSSLEAPALLFVRCTLCARAVSLCTRMRYEAALYTPRANRKCALLFKGSVHMYMRSRFSLTLPFVVPGGHASVGTAPPLLLRGVACARRKQARRCTHTRTSRRRRKVIANNSERAIACLLRFPLYEIIFSNSLRLMVSGQKIIKWHLSLYELFFSNSLCLMVSGQKIIKWTTF